MLLLARLTDQVALRFSGEAQSADDESRMTEEMGFADEMCQRFPRLEPSAVVELEHDPIEDGGGRCQALREKQFGGERHGLGTYSDQRGGYRKSLEHRPEKSWPLREAAIFRLL